MRLELHATPEEVMRAVETLRALGESKQLPEKMLFGLTLALEEAASNIVNHALKRDPSQSFQVLIEPTGAAVVIELRDRGPAFDPTRSVVSADGANEEERPAGGWGLQLMRRFTDDIRYRREGDENVLRLTKRQVHAKGIRKRNTRTKQHRTPESTKKHATRNSSTKRHRSQEGRGRHGKAHRQS